MFVDVKNTEMGENRRTAAPSPAPVQACVLSEGDVCPGNPGMTRGTLSPVLPLPLNSTDVLLMMEISM